MLLGIGRWALLRIVNNEFGCCILPQPWGAVYLAGASPQEKEELERDLLRLPPGDLGRLVRSDFGMSRSRARPIVVLYIAPRIFLRFVSSLRLQDHLSAAGSEPRAWHYPSLGTVFATGNPGTQEFRHALVHALGLAHCDDALNTTRAIPWALAGYVVLLCARLGALYGTPTDSYLRQSLESIVALIESHRLMPVEELMRATPKRVGELAGGEYPWFHAESALFMLMLLRRARNDSALHTLCKEAIGGRTPAETVIGGLEACTGLRIALIHGVFVAFCRSLMASEFVEPRILSPETMVQ